MNIHFSIWKFVFTLSFFAKDGRDRFLYFDIYTTLSKFTFYFGFLRGQQAKINSVPPHTECVFRLFEYRKYWGVP